MKKIIPFLLCMLVALWACEKETPNSSASIDSMQFEGVTTTLNEGESINLSQYLVITPASVGDTVTIEWSSNNEEIATVSASGSVEALRAGDVTITAKAMDKTAQVKLTIDKVKIKEFTIPATLEVYVGEKIKFPINDLKPKKAPLYRFEWDADNDGKIPTYSEGKWYLKADKEREYTLTVSVDDADDAKCNVKFVKPSVSKLTFNPTSYTVEAENSLSLKTNLVITPADGMDADTIKVVWSSSKESVATIDQNGKVQAIAAGKATITANAGGKTATCTVEVTAKPGSEDPEKPEDPENPEDPDTPVDPSDPVIPMDKEFTITFEANGGTGYMNSIKVKDTENTNIMLPINTFTRESYEFTGWNTKADGKGISYKDESSIPLVNEDITLYAQWKEKSYIVSFSANGGRGSISPITVASGKKLKLPTNSFTFDDYFFVCWNTEANGDGISYKNEEEISVTANITLYAQWRLPKGMSNGYEWVDLGLSSGTKWATMNVGATYPEDFGDFFAWGETETKTVYDWSTYKWCDGSVNRINKYSRNSDGLELQDDAAFVNWGGNWRTPTSEEQDELRNECTWIWTTQNGVDGYKIQSKINGNSIFLPAAGFYSETSGKVYYSNIYWSRTPSREYQEYAYNLTILSNKIDSGSVSRCCGLPVRAVLP